MSLPLDDNDRRLVATVLMDDHEELTPELLENAVRSLRKRVHPSPARRLAAANQRTPSAARCCRLSAGCLQERVQLRRAMTAVGDVRS